MSKIVIYEYDEQWAEIFRSLKQVIEFTLTNLIIKVEHVGSTAVKGLGAKPILDIDLVIKSDDDLPAVSKGLQKIGYFHQEEWSYEGREAFGRKDQFTPWDGNHTNWMDHHVYVCTQDSKELARHLAFRDYLRSDPDAVAKYDRVKRNLANMAKNRADYTMGKTNFITMILERTFDK
ncbi:GrpB family protein [Bacillus sp. RAR_GA_16]|uniref:GrpB family protein n=1 Tax=Bacillus sp. RAR_GA_16 TaxID=2876774 RepID=UPI001CD01FBD|nr:GrpB family protein [Bacillus sp. RAR_GA_16]MCA0170912.1 GrpB family protein [Bacillus sp. RAR_GA_16]